MLCLGWIVLKALKKLKLWIIHEPVLHCNLSQLCFYWCTNFAATAACKGRAVQIHSYVTSNISLSRCSGKPASEDEIRRTKLEITCRSPKLFKMILSRATKQLRNSIFEARGTDLHVSSCESCCSSGWSRWIVAAGKACSCSQKLLTYCKGKEDYADMAQMCTDVEHHSL